MDGLKSMQPRSLTFCERMRLTYALLLARLPMPTVWLPIVWSSGATVSISLIVPRSARLDIESADGQKSVSVAIIAKQVT